MVRIVFLTLCVASCTGTVHADISVNLDGKIVIADGAQFSLTDDLTVATGGVLDCTGATGTLRVGGNWTINGTFIPGSTTVGFNGVLQNISSSTGTNSFAKLNVGIDTTPTTVILQNNVTVTQGSASLVSQGTLRLNGKTLRLDNAGSSSILTGGTLQLDAGSRLELGSGASLTVNSGGTLKTNGTSEFSRATITRISTGTFSATVNGTVNLKYANLYYLSTAGLVVNSWSSGSSLDFCVFDYPADNSPLLDLSGVPAGTGNFNIMGCKFENSANALSPKNVKGLSTNTTTFTFLNYSGSLASSQSVAAANELDGDPPTPATTGQIRWSDNGQAVRNVTTSKYYGSLAEAISAATAGDVLEPATNRIFSGSVTINKQVTLRNFIINGDVTLSGVSGIVLYNCVIKGSVTDAVGASTSKILNCTVLGNISLTGTSSSVKNCIATGTISAPVTQTNSASFPISGFVAQDVLDLHVKSDSGAIDNGTDLSAEMPAVDFEGNTRPKGLGWDCGADEHYSSNTTQTSKSQLGITYFTSGGTTFKPAPATPINGIGRFSRPKGAGVLNVSPCVYIIEGTKLHMFNASTGDEIIAPTYPYDVINDIAGANRIVGMTSNAAFRYSSSEALIFGLLVDTSGDGLAEKIDVVKDDGSSISKIQVIDIPAGEQSKSIAFAWEDYGDGNGLRLVIHLITNTGSGMAGTKIYRYKQASTKLTAPVTSANVTSITVASTAGFPASGTVYIDGDPFTYDTTTANTFSKATGMGNASTHANGASVISHFAEASLVTGNMEYRVAPALLTPLNYVYCGLTGHASNKLVGRISSSSSGYTMTAIAGGSEQESASLNQVFVEQPSAVPSSDVANRVAVASPSDGRKIYFFNYATLADNPPVASINIGGLNSATHLRMSSFQNCLFMGAGPLIFKVRRTGTIGQLASSPWPLGDGIGAGDITVSGNIVGAVIIRGTVGAGLKKICAVTDDGYIYVATADWDVLDGTPGDGAWLLDSPYRLPGSRCNLATGNFVDGFYATTEDGYVVKIRPF